VNWEEQMEAEWGPALAHESGHALMAVLRGIPCHGIYFERCSRRFCAVTGNSSSNHSKDDYLVSVAGAAAELLVYPDRISEGTGADDADFDSLDALPRGEIESEARLILSGEKRNLESLISALKAKIKGVDFDLGRLPEVGMDGSNKRYLTLLDARELGACIVLHRR
jgi:hypothetical protein